MSAHLAPSRERARPPLHTSPAPPQSYCPVPQRLIADLHDTPLAIGLYALLARLYFVAQAPVPLSVPDVMRYDPTLSRGAIIRAFARLAAGGWLVETGQRGHKTRYAPTWGRVKGAPLPWRMDQPCLGRPRHIARLMLDRTLLDVCMGKLTPHPVQTAPITRYVTTPALSLADIGCYALTLAGFPRETPALRRLGLVRQGQACPLPAERTLLAIISQRPLALDDDAGPIDTALTASGARRLGVVPVRGDDGGRAQPLFFVPPDMIGSMIRPMIGSMIGQDAAPTPAPAAPVGHEARSDGRPEGITWESRELRDTGTPPPTPPKAHDGGGGAGDERHDRKTARGAAGRAELATDSAALVIPDTEATRLLRAINVLPEQLIELAELPAETVRAAIADGSARPGVRDPAGWVVKLLRTHRDYGWAIAPPAPRADAPAALAAAFAQYAAQQAAEQGSGDPGQPAAEAAASEPAPPSDAARLWSDVLTVLQLQLSRQEFASWIRPAVLHGVEGGVATVMVPDDRIKAAIERSYLPALRAALEQRLGTAAQVRIILMGAEPSADGATRLDQRASLDPLQAPGAAAPGVTAAADASIALRPGWIGVERWHALPALLRAALLGSTLVDGVVKPKSSHLARLLETRYAREVRDLLGGVLSST